LRGLEVNGKGVKTGKSRALCCQVEQREDENGSALDDPRDNHGPFTLFPFQRDQQDNEQARANE
jgi:hypothetical protein